VALPVAAVLTVMKEAILPASAPGTPIAQSAMDGVILKVNFLAVDLHLSTMDPTMLLDIRNLDRLIFNL